MQSEPSESDEFTELPDWEEGYIGDRRSLRFDGTTSDYTAVYLYESERDADPGALEDHVEANRDVGDEFATLEGYSISERGRVLVLSGSRRTRAL